MSTGSFIGFAGTEDLGGGLKAHFVLESYLGADTGWAGGPSTDKFESSTAANFWSRTSHVALTGNFGKVALGQYDSVLYTMLTGFSPLGDSQVFAPNQVLHYGSSMIDPNGNVAEGIGQGTSWVNSITYETPNMAGFSAAVQYAPKENADTGSTNKNNLGASVSYTAGPLAASFVYTRTGDNGQYYTENYKTTGLAASYDFGVAKLSGIYTKTKPDYNDTWNSKFYQIGAAIPVTAAGKVAVAYGQRKFTDSGFNEKAKQFSVAYEHTLSKRTSVYAAAGNLKYSNNDGDASIKSTNYAFGIKHNF